MNYSKGEIKNEIRDLRKLKAMIFKLESAKEIKRLINDNKSNSKLELKNEIIVNGYSEDDIMREVANKLYKASGEKVHNYLSQIS